MCRWFHYCSVPESTFTLQQKLKDKMFTIKSLYCRSLNYTLHRLDLKIKSFSSIIQLQKVQTSKIEAPNGSQPKAHTMRNIQYRHQKYFYIMQVYPALPDGGLWFFYFILCCTQPSAEVQLSEQSTTVHMSTIGHANESKVYSKLLAVSVNVAKLTSSNHTEWIFII